MVQLEFNPDGTLSEGIEIKAECEAGTKYDFNLTISKVHTGNGFAVVAGLNDGTVTGAEGDATDLDYHFTAVLVKKGGTWQFLYHHYSPNIEPEEAEEE